MVTDSTWNDATCCSLSVEVGDGLHRTLNKHNKKRSNRMFATGTTLRSNESLVAHSATPASSPILACHCLSVTPLIEWTNPTELLKAAVPFSSSDLSFTSREEIDPSFFDGKE